jgi:hypothetical protein
MSTNPQVPPHEADTGGRFTSNNAKEMGSRGAARREQNWQEKVTLHREELEKHAEAAIRSLGEILAGDAKDSDKLKAAQTVLDRVGLGPHSSQELNVGLPSLVEQWAEELQALPPLTDEQGDGA